MAGQANGSNRERALIWPIEVDDRESMAKIAQVLADTFSQGSWARWTDGSSWQTKKLGGEYVGHAPNVILADGRSLAEALHDISLCETSVVAFMGEMAREKGKEIPWSALCKRVGDNFISRVLVGVDIGYHAKPHLKRRNIPDMDMDHLIGLAIGRQLRNADNPDFDPKVTLPVNVLSQRLRHVGIRMSPEDVVKDLGLADFRLAKE